MRFQSRVNQLLNHAARRLSIAALVLLFAAVMAPAGLVYAQSADDGFNPGANGPIHTLALQADGKILVGGNFTTLGGQPRNRIARLNAGGTPEATFNPGANGPVHALSVQADGKILVGGDFTSLAGQTRNRIARLNADGSLDTTFNPGANNPVRSLVVQADGKILVGGDFTSLAGQTRNRIARLNADGSLDSTFNPGANNRVRSLVVQADGKILVGGDFTSLAGQSRNRIARLNRDGSPDATFNSGANGVVRALALQVDGRILVGGDFRELSGFTRERLGRLNTNGSIDTTFNPGVSKADPNAVVQVYALVVQTNGKILVGGDFSRLAGQPFSHIGRLNFNGLIDSSFNPGADNVIHALALQADGKILAGGGFITLAGEPRSFIGRIHADGNPDRTFSLGADATVRALALQADGKILVGGDFTALDGQSRNRIGRLNTNAAIDTTFVSSGANNIVRTLALQADGKIVVGGDFSTLGGQSRSRIGRLNANGAIDTTFNPGTNGSVRALALQADGKILVGGDFTTLGGQPLSHIARINTSGTPDLSFASGANNTVHTLAVQADGKILVGGNFTLLGGQPRNRIARLHEDGTLDSDFNPGADNPVFALAVQADGKILVGGAFTALGGQNLTIRRLNPNGSLDTTFNPGANGSVRTLAVQADGKILAAGNFTILAEQTRNRMGRLNANGSLDTSFNPGADGFVISLALQTDGKVLVGGEFNTLAGQTRNHIGRLSNDTAAVQSLEILPGGITVKWLRSGASPELEHVIFESSANDVSYSLLGPGMRTNGGWMLTGLALPLQQNLFIRARGYYASGESTGSSSVAESVRIAHLNRDETGTMLTTVPNPSIRGQNVSLKATVRGVTPDSGVPTGTATLTVNAIPLETRPLDASGVVTYNTSNLTVGDHSISVQYSGDASFNGNQTDPITQTVKPAETVTTLFSTPNFSLFGQPVTLRATVSVLSPGAGIADGNVTFMLNGTPLETRPLDFGLAFHTLSDLPVGEHNFSVHYEGSDSFNSSTSEPIKQTVARANTTTALVISPNPAVFGQSIGLAAFVNVSAPGAGTPSGNVTFAMNGTPLEARPLSAGVATYSVPDLAVGEYLFTVEYEGDESFNGSSGQPVTQAVERAGTTIQLVGTPNPSVVGESVTLTATVGVVSPGNGTPTGAVTFSADGAPLDSFTLDASGVITYTTSALPVGEHLIAVQYEGDLSFQDSTALPIMQTVQRLWEIYLPLLEGSSEDVEGEGGVSP